MPPKRKRSYTCKSWASLPPKSPHSIARSKSRQPKPHSRAAAPSLRPSTLDLRQHMYFLKRLLFLLPVLLVISVLGFVLLHVAPGGPFDRERAPATPEIERNLKAKYHLDEPLYKQYLRYLGIGFEKDAAGKLKLFDGGLIRGDFGPSLKYRNHTVNDIVAQALPVSMALGLLAFCFAQGIGIPLGFYTAVRRGQWGDYIGSFLAILVVCVPGLVVGPLLAMGFAIHWRLLPAALWESPLHAILPTLTLGLYFSGKVARLMRAGMLGVVHRSEEHTSELQS